MFDLNDFILTRLSPGSARKPFDCGKPDLNEFFHKDSIDHSLQLLAVTYAVEDKNETVAYFSVLNDNVRGEDTTNSRKKKILKKIPHSKRGYPSHPAVKVGRFAVSKKYQKKGLGKALMDFIKGWFTIQNKTGCRFITVDADKDAVEFYKKNGFDFFTAKDEEKELRIMWFDLKIFVRD